MVPEIMLNNSSALAEMGNHLATIDMGRKEGGCCAPFAGGELGPHEHNVAWAEVYLHSKCHLDPSSRLVTIDMGQKLTGCAGGSWVPI